MKLFYYLEKNYKILYFFAMLAVALWVAYIKGWIFANFDSISAKEALALIEQKRYPIVDIRPKEQYEKGHIKGSLSLPFSTFPKSIGKLAPYKKSKIILYSKSGREGIDASRILIKEGFHPINVKSGILGLALVGANTKPELFTK
ncbi:MAG TPA: rhodanese-like domain-containing protein [Nitratifractor sp.]|nr:rhodanese-like domain-containing protein [Nitratifractor sp.]